MVALQNKVRSQLTRGYGYPNGLTKREVEVLRLVAAGKTNPEIAQNLVISVTTARTHVIYFLNKINAAKIAHEASYAEREGLV